MAIPAAEFVKNGYPVATSKNCAICGKPILCEHSDKVQMIDDGVVHEDCYYEQLGKVVEEQQIEVARRQARQQVSPG